MEISYNPSKKIYSIDNQEFTHDTMVAWVKSGGLAQTLLKNRLRLLTENSVHLSAPTENCIRSLSYRHPHKTICALGGYFRYS